MHDPQNWVWIKLKISKAFDFGVVNSLVSWYKMLWQCFNFFFFFNFWKIIHGHPTHLSCFRVYCFLILFQLLYLLLKSERVYEKSKARLRLTDIGHSGLTNLMTSYDISAPMIKRFIEQVSCIGKLCYVTDIFIFQSVL